MTKEKSNKQKCLDMWEWLAANPGKDKIDYSSYLKSIDKESEYSYCWACRDCESICSQCPIWSNTDDHRICLGYNSPYKTWSDVINIYDDPNTIEESGLSIQAIQDLKQSASDMVNLIKTTWKD